MSLAGFLLALALAPGQGSRVVERRFTAEVELATERFEVVGSEEETTEVKRLPLPVREQADEIEIVDTFLDDEDPPASFERLYRTVMRASDVGRKGSPQSQTTSAALAGKTVTFERERDGTYARRCDDPDARPVQLKRLRAELSLAPFLPPPAEGPDGAGEGPESWEVPNAELGRLFSPLEAEVRRPRPKESEPKSGLRLAPAALGVPLGALLSAPEGSLTATRLPSDEEEELPCRARLAFRLNGTYDGSAMLLVGRTGETEDELTLTYQGTGLLAWDPDSGAIEIELEGEARLVETFRAVIEGNGATAEVKGELVMSGTMGFTGRELPGD